MKAFKPFRTKFAKAKLHTSRKGGLLCSNRPAAASPGQRKGRRISTKHYLRPIPGALDPRSHFTKDGRTVLYGKDMELLRLAVYFRCNGYCEAKSHASACPKWVGWDEGELDHVIPKRMGGAFRDDTEDNTQWLSQPCHLEKHRAKEKAA